MRQMFDSNWQRHPVAERWGGGGGLGGTIGGFSRDAARPRSRLIVFHSLFSFHHPYPAILRGSFKGFSAKALVVTAGWRCCARGGRWRRAHQLKELFYTKKAQIYVYYLLSYFEVRVGGKILRQHVYEGDFSMQG